jgi:hypothetical protein
MRIFLATLSRSDRAVVENGHLDPNRRTSIMECLTLKRRTFLLTALAGSLTPFVSKAMPEQLPILPQRGESSHSWIRSVARSKVP